MNRWMNAWEEFLLSHIEQIISLEFTCFYKIVSLILERWRENLGK